MRLPSQALACSARATGTVSARIGGRLRRLSLISRRVRLAAGRSALVRLGLTPRNRALVAAALTARRPAVVRVRVAVTDASAATTTLSRTRSAWCAEPSGSSDVELLGLERPVRKREPARAEVEGSCGARR